MAASSMHKSILIVDDQEGIHQLLIAILSHFYCVESASTASAALEIIIDRPIDLVIMDVCLPDYDGVELLRRVRARGRDVKVIMITGVAGMEPE
jgi:DNA-binding NtrC family response regulator